MNPKLKRRPKDSPFVSVTSAEEADAELTRLAIARADAWARSAPGTPYGEVLRVQNPEQALQASQSL